MNSVPLGGLFITVTGGLRDSRFMVDLCMFRRVQEGSKFSLVLVPDHILACQFGGSVPLGLPSPCAGAGLGFGKASPKMSRLWLPLFTDLHFNGTTGRVRTQL